MSLRPPAEPKTDWSRRLKVWGGITVAVLLGLLIGAAFIPRWWAQRVGDQANESFAGGIMLGLFYGFVFTVLPLLLIVWGIRRRRSGRMWLWILVGAMLLALPNLMTLGIVVGPGQRRARGGQDARRRGAGLSRRDAGRRTDGPGRDRLHLVPAVLAPPGAGLDARA